MTTTRDHALSLEELSSTLDAFAGPARPRTHGARHRWGSRRLALAVALVTLIIAGCSYAVHFNPFAGISAAEHPAGSSDALPAFLKAQITDWNKKEGKASRYHLLASTARFVRRLPDGMRFYAIATSGGPLCVAKVHPRSSFPHGSGITELGGFTCGDALSPSQPITMTNWLNGSYINGKQVLGTPISYGLALDGITEISFDGGPFHVTVPVTNNVWVHLGRRLPEIRITVHWDDGTRTRLYSNPDNGTWSTRRP
jgi:hypothetical protein